MIRRLFISVFLLLAASVVMASTIRVPADQPDIQSGIDAAANNDTVLVADGTYTGNGNRDIDFGGKAVVLRSENGLTLTVIDCQGTPADYHRGFFFHSGETSSTVIDGFQIINGYAPYHTGSFSYKGGGILCDGSSPTIRNCMIRQCDATTMGGGMSIIGGSSPFIENCDIRNNDVSNAEVSIGYGGGVESNSSTPYFTGCIFRDNSANSGAGVSVIEASAIFENCQFQGNNAPYHDSDDQSLQLRGTGGGIYLERSASTLNSCTFFNNVAQNYGGTGNAIDGAGHGGAIALYQSDAIITNCTISGNTANRQSTLPGRGGGIYCDHSSPTISSSIIAFSLDGGSFFCADLDCNPVLSCTDIYGNTGGVHNDADWGVSCITTQQGTDDNFSDNPLFLDAANGDLRLHANSPCAEANSPCSNIVGALPVNVRIRDDNRSMPVDFVLHQNYPNPFNPATTIEFEIPRREHVRISIYNVLGQVVRIVVDEPLSAGKYSVQWDGTDHHGQSVSSGVYFYRIEGNNYATSKKMILLK